MNKLYQGKINQEDTDKAIEELSIIKKELQAFTPDKAIWDIENISKQPPWGNNISKDITDLSNYFITSNGEDFISVFFSCVREGKRSKFRCRDKVGVNYNKIVIFFLMSHKFPCDNGTYRGV